MLLEKFKQASPKSRMAAIKRKRCPVDVLMYAAKEEPLQMIRSAALAQANCPIEALRYSFKDDSANIRNSALSNLNCPIELLIEGGRNRWFAAFQNPNCPADSLREALQPKEDPYIRWLAVLHPNCPVDALTEALNDPDFYIRREAFERI